MKSCDIAFCDEEDILFRQIFEIFALHEEVRMAWRDISYNDSVPSCFLL